MGRVTAGSSVGGAIFTIEGNRVCPGYGEGSPIFTGEGCGLMSLAASASVSLTYSRFVKFVLCCVCERGYFTQS